MLIKFLQGEYIFDEQGLGVGDENGVHKKAIEEMHIEIADDKVAHVLAYLEFDRAERGLDKDGNPIPPPQPEPVVEVVEPVIEESQQQNEQLIIDENTQSGVENGV